MKLDKVIQKGLNFFHIPHNEKAINDLCFYVLELKKWNEHMNLTGLKDLHCIVSELLYDAFFLCSRMNEINSVLDMGSGAGILAIPVNILNENLKVFSVDKSLKKIQYQSHIKRTLGLKNLIPVHGRSESLDPMGVDALIVKGFGSIEEILKKGEIHIRAGGSAFILKGKNENPIVYQGFKLDDIIPYTLPASNKAYMLFVYRKI